MGELALVVEKIKQFRDDRNWKQFHNHKDVAISLVLEATELLEHFQWKNPDEVDKHARENLAEIEEEIADVENKLAAARRFFNSSTKELNVAVEVFPSNIVASMFGFKKEMMFDLGGDGRKEMEEPPAIKF